MTDMLSAALALAERGMCIFPCKPRGKTPITRRGCLDATNDLDVIRGWWTGGPDLNVAIATGSPSGVWVLDIDGPEGEASLRDLERRMRPLPETVEVITGSGGRHLYFRLSKFPDAPAIKNTASKIAPKLDTRGEGGYCIAPPSLHPCGRRYAWSVDSGSEFADPPVWLLGLFATPAPRPAGYFSDIANGVTDGRRNESLASLTGKLLRVGLLPSQVLHYLRYWNEKNTPPLPDERLKIAVKNIWHRERDRRLG